MIKTDHIAVLTHSSIKVQCEAGTVYFDPFHIPEESHDADAILITHEHYDHFSPEDIKKIAKSDTLVVVPEGMKTKAEKELPSGCRIQTVKPGEKYQIGELEFETIPAYNRLKPFHPVSAQSRKRNRLCSGRYRCHGGSSAGALRHCAGSGRRHIHDECQTGGGTDQQDSACGCNSNALRQRGWFKGRCSGFCRKSRSDDFC